MGLETTEKDMDKKTELAIDLGQTIYTNTINSLTQQRDELRAQACRARNLIECGYTAAALNCLCDAIEKVGADVSGAAHKRLLNCV